MHAQTYIRLQHLCLVLLLLLPNAGIAQTTKKKQPNDYRIFLGYEFYKSAVDPIAARLGYPIWQTHREEFSAPQIEFQFRFSGSGGFCEVDGSGLLTLPIGNLLFNSANPTRNEPMEQTWGYASVPENFLVAATPYGAERTSTAMMRDIRVGGVTTGFGKRAILIGFKLDYELTAIRFSPVPQRGHWEPPLGPQETVDYTYMGLALSLWMRNNPDVEAKATASPTVVKVGGGAGVGTGFAFDLHCAMKRWKLGPYMAFKYRSVSHAKMDRFGDLEKTRISFAIGISMGGKEYRKPTS